MNNIVKLTQMCIFLHTKQRKGKIVVLRQNYLSMNGIFNEDKDSVTAKKF